MSCSAFAAAGGVVVDAGPGDDSIGIHGPLRSVVFGDLGSDRISGGDDDDELDGGANGDELYGDEGFDSVDYSDHRQPVSVTIDAHAGDGGVEDNSFAFSNRDFVSQSVEQVIGTPANDTSTGGAGPDVLLGGAGQDVLDGAGGDDRLDGQEGPDTLVGGPGVDTADYSGRQTGVQISLDDQNNDGDASDGPPNARDDVRRDVENVLGTDADDRIVGSDAPNLLDGRGGNDVLLGQDGADSLLGSSGADTLLGEGGDDVLDGESDRDALDGGDGADRLLAVDGVPDFLACGAGEDSGEIDLFESKLRPDAKLGPSRVGCEQLAIAPVHEHPTVRIARVRLRRQSVRVTLACPRHHPRCQGRVSLRAGTRTLARARYALAPGRRTTVVLRLREPATEPLKVVAAERDRRGRPITVIRTLG